jgi:pimeloyl-ACP methyl ester carboxylesterase
MQRAPHVIDGLDRQKLRFVDADGYRTRLYEDGAGEPLVLIHGGRFGNTYSLDAWSLNLPGLADHFHVYAPDKLGSGHTDNPKTDADYTFEAIFRHMHELLLTLGITGAHIVGHSRGGLLATHLALRHPELAKTLIIVDSITTTPDPPEGANREPGAERVAEDQFDKPDVVGPTTREAVRAEPDAQAYSRAQVTDDYVDRILEFARLHKFREVSERFRALNRSVFAPSYRRARDEALQMIDEGGVPVPTLVFWGRNDRSAPIDRGRLLFDRICARTPAAEFHVVNGAGHYSFREQPLAFNRAVQSFCLQSQRMEMR